MSTTSHSVSDGVTQAECAQRLGVTQSLISRYVRDGKLSKLPNGRLDPERAARELQQAVDPLKVPGRKTGRKTEPQPASSLYASQERRARALADKEELELAEMRGRLVDREEALRALTTLSRQTRDRIMGISARVASRLATMTNAAEIRGMLDDELRVALEELAAGRK